MAAAEVPMSHNEVSDKVPIEPATLEWSNITNNVQEKKVHEVSEKVSIEPVTLEWSQITYDVQVKKGRQATKKRVLSDISGHAEAGTFTSILGASGSGKTSLLSVLADRLLSTKGARLSGTFNVNGSARSSSYRLQCAFVQQVEVFYPFQSVRETVEMAARLRLGCNVSRDVKRQRAVDIIRQLGLKKAIDTKVGDGKRIKGISGGEMKRVAIACELVSRPSILMLDEPTSGLDSSSALNVVQILVDLAQRGCTVIASIHQPGSSLYSLFQNMVLLAEGKMAYFGTASNVVAYFGGMGLDCPALFNPADFMLEITSIDYTSTEAEEMSRQRLQKVHDHFKPHLDTAAIKSRGVGSTIQGGSSFFEQFGLLYKRVLRNTLRNKAALGLKAFQKAFMALMLVGLYSDLDSASTIEVVLANFKAMLFVITITGLFTPLFGTINSFSPEVSIVLRERMNDLYPVAPYFLAKLFQLIPVEMLPVVISNSVSFWLLKLPARSADRYLIHVVITSMCYFTSMSLGLMFAAMTCGHPEAATALISPFALVFLLLGGFYVNIDTIPVWIRWLGHINYFAWTYEALSINTFLDVDTVGDFSQSGNEVLEKDFNKGRPMGENGWEELLWFRMFLFGVLIVVFNIGGYLLLLSKGPKYLRLQAPGGAAA